MEDLKSQAISRISEKLSKGENFRKLLELHISPYENQEEINEFLLNLKDIDKANEIQLDWIGIIKGIKRPFTVVNKDELNQFFSFYDDESSRLKFNEFDSVKPLYFGEENYYRADNETYRKILKAACVLTNFTGSLDEYEYFFKEVFGLNVYLQKADTYIDIIVENAQNTDDVMIADLTPSLPKTATKLNKSLYSQFVLDFENIEGSNIFEEEVSLYFPLKV